MLGHVWLYENANEIRLFTAGIGDLHLRVTFSRRDATLCKRRIGIEFSYGAPDLYFFLFFFLFRLSFSFLLFLQSITPAAELPRRRRRGSRRSRVSTDDRRESRSRRDAPEIAREKRERERGFCPSRDSENSPGQALESRPRQDRYARAGSVIVVARTRVSSL